MIYNIQNKQDLDKYVAEAVDKLVVLDFHASWCGPCQLIKPQLQELSTRYNDRVLILKINVDDCEDIAMDYNITSMPTFVFMKNHQIIDFLVGGNTEKLTKNMEKYASEDIPTAAEDTQLN